MDAVTDRAPRRNDKHANHLRAELVLLQARYDSVAPVPARDRAWWAEESLRAGTDWVSIGHAAMLAFAGIVERAPSTFGLACERADRERP